MSRLGISIVVITYNEEKQIERCISSILKLDYSPLEILIVDASEDRTGEIVKSINDTRIRYFSVSSKGYSIQRNIGIRNARHPLVAFTDADCTVPADWLSKLAPIVATSVAGAGGNAFPPKGSKGLGLCIACLGFPAGGAIGLDANLPNSGEVILATCNAIFQREILLQIGGFNESLKYGGEDTNICYSIYQAGYEIKYLRDSYVYHQVRSDILEVSRWCIRRGKANAQLTRKRASSIFWNVLILCFFVLWLLLASISIVSHGYITLLGSVFLFALSSLILFTSSKKFRLAWLRRKVIGIGILKLLVLVPALFFMRRLLMAVGGIQLMATKLIE